MPASCPRQRGIKLLLFLYKKSIVSYSKPSQNTEDKC